MKVEDRLDAIERELAEIKATLSSSKNLKIVKLKIMERAQSRRQGRKSGHQLPLQAWQSVSPQE
jgi:hypothetical protein